VDLTPEEMEMRRNMYGPGKCCTVCVIVLLSILIYR